MGGKAASRCFEGSDSNLVHDEVHATTVRTDSTRHSRTETTLVLPARSVSTGILVLHKICSCFLHSSLYYYTRVGSNICNLEIRSRMKVFIKVLTYWRILEVSKQAAGLIQFMRVIVITR